MQELANQVESIGESLDTFEQNVMEREKAMKEEGQREKSKWEDTLHEKIKQQLDAKEEAYFDMMNQLQARIRNLADSHLHSSSVLDSVFHRAVALAISGAGTIISFVVGIVGIILYPFTWFQNVLNRNGSSANGSKSNSIAS